MAIRYADILTGVDREGARGDDARPEDEADDAADSDDASEADEANAGNTASESDDVDAGVGPDGVAIDDLLAGIRRGGDEPGEVDDPGDADPGAPDSSASTAMLDVDPAQPGAIADDDANAATGAAGSSETYESWMRHRRPSRWGRLDVGVAWQRRWSEPLHAMSHRFDEIWLVATWRR